MSSSSSSLSTPLNQGQQALLQCLLVIQKVFLGLAAPPSIAQMGSIVRFFLQGRRAMTDAEAQATMGAIESNYGFEAPAGDLTSAFGVINKVGTLPNSRPRSLPFREDSSRAHEVFFSMPLSCVSLFFI